MAVITKPSTAIEQPVQSQGLATSGEATYRRAFKDTYENLKTWLETLSNGDTLDGKGLSSADLARNPGNMGTLTLLLTDYSETTSEGGTTTVDALDETWTLKSVRNDKSLLAYCGPSEGNNPWRPDIEAWLKEPDGTIAAKNKYKKSDGTEKELSDASKKLVEKYNAGHDSVMRFYPMLTKTRTYAVPPTKVYENLASIDTPTIGNQKLKMPGNLSAIISGHEWLKIQDDLELCADGKFKRVESWIGAKKGEESWDADFYGSSRWKMPLQ